MPSSIERPVGKRVPIVYPSAIDLWLGTLLLLTPVSAAAVGIYLWWVGDPGGASVLFLTGAAAVLLTAAFTTPCRYTILEDAVSIRCGLAFKQIPLDRIDRAESKWSLASGWGLSARRVAIHCGTREVLISPQDREAFLKDLRDAMRRIEMKESPPVSAGPWNAR